MREIRKLWMWITFTNNLISRFSRLWHSPSSTRLLVWRTAAWPQRGCVVLSGPTWSGWLTVTTESPPHHCSYQVLRLPFVRNVALEEAISLCHPSLCVYPIPPSFLEVSDVPMNDIRMIIITIMYWFSGSIVALWVSAFPCIIVGLQTG